MTKKKLTQLQFLKMAWNVIALACYINFFHVCCVANT